MTVLNQTLPGETLPGEALRSLAPAPAGDPAAWGSRNAHDPTVVRDTDGTWYMFSTDAAAGAGSVQAGVHVRRSDDLVRWTFAGTALDGVPGAAFEWSQAPGLWAPEVVRWPAPGAADDDGDTGAVQWHMYYSASTFGSSTSAIGLAVASRLAGPWEDRGIVVATRAGTDSQNAIDAAVTVDRSGIPWLTYGSFFSGIYTLPLNPETGGPQTPGDLGTLIARRPVSVDRAIEGAFIVYRREEDRYLLFCSYDSLFDSYNVRVAVAEEITGPYTDVLGHSMTDLDSALEPCAAALIGTKVLGSHRFGDDTGWLAPGHNSILIEPGLAGSIADEYFMVHHVRFADDPTQHVVQLRRTFFTEAGWPVVSPQPFAGADPERLAVPVSLAGPWRAVRLAPESSALVNADTVTVTMAPTVLVPTGPDTADAPERLFDGRTELVRLVVGGTDTVGGAASGTELDAVVFTSWDWANARPALSFSGLAADGVAWFGTRGA
ncbi:arabinan endo-1,5-alpha-L-arabinosidase [Cryobacterium adonitolivorans]|uniref:Arabinan endo-1,5-alpha-L-arabinosidase n=1 Tax=Cryobacterium adonitolivorans TaxID=1259189 RepID=A0A4R8WAA5_9MICO|nr:arabinan endo-1,5-alpha-L-arabinosidase [Cryobacterium adonitolivorans]TFC05627.1 arabinan endo-1,5-alpha-L-arabinosidase [Cryobacterium adonitolivorans]